MIKKITLIVCFYFFVINSSFADEIKIEEKACPLCKTKLKVTSIQPLNKFILDYDLYPHDLASPSIPLSNYVVRCYNCNYCGLAKDFEKKYTDEEKNKLTLWLKENYPPSKGLEKLESFLLFPPFKCFEIAAQLSATNKESNYQIGKLYLASAWSIRTLHLILDKNGNDMEYDSSEFFGDKNNIIQQEYINLNKRLNLYEANTFTYTDFIVKIAEKIEKLSINDENEKLNYFCSLAYRLRIAGENTKAEFYIKKAEKCSNSSQFFDLFEGLRNSIKKERYYQSKVIEFLTASLNDNLTEKQKLEVYLLLGEMNRRLEKFDEAQKYYSKLLETSEALPDIYIRALKFANSNMGSFGNISKETFDRLDERRINDYLDKLSNPVIGSEAANYLRYSTRRDIIFPRLKEIIISAIDNPPDYYKLIKEKNGTKYFIDEETQRIKILDKFTLINNFKLENALFALSDETKEAAEFLSDLFFNHHSYFTISITKSLKPIVHFLPSDKFVQGINKTTNTYEIDNYAELLKLINDKPSFEALLAKTEKLLTEENLKKLSDSEFANKNIYGYTSLIDALTAFRGKRTISFLVNLCETIIKVNEEFSEENKNIHDLQRLYEETGNALEIMYFRHFGFTDTFYRIFPPRRLESLTRFKILEEPTISFKEWFSAHEKEDYKKIIYEGFKKYGYDVLPVSDPKKLYILIEGFDDDFPPARIQCYKELVRRIDVKKRPDIGLNNKRISFEEKRELFSFYLNWLDKNINKLVYDEKKQKFVIK